MNSIFNYANEILDLIEDKNFKETFIKDIENE